MRTAKDALVAVGAVILFAALSPLLIIPALLFEEDPVDSYRNQNW